MSEDASKESLAQSTLSVNDDKAQLRSKQRWACFLRGERRYLARPPVEKLEEEEHAGEADVLVERVLDQAPQPVVREVPVHQQEPAQKPTPAPTPLSESRPWLKGPCE